MRVQLGAQLVAGPREEVALPVLALAVGAAEVVPGDVTVGVAHQHRLAAIEEQLHRLARVGAPQRQVPRRHHEVGAVVARCPRSTASQAGRFPWMSARMATRMAP